jgi:hypothetical protein
MRGKASNRKKSLNVGLLVSYVTEYKVIFGVNIADTWGRCYDYNFLRFFPIFGEKNGVFLK